MPKRPYSLWLVPAEPDRTNLGRVIAELAGRFGTPTFPPHATLCSGHLWHASQETGAAETLRTLAHRLAPLTLPIMRVDYTRDYFTSFFARLAPASFVSLASHLGTVLEGSTTPAIGPHVSLMYTDEENKMNRAALAEEVGATLPSRIVFDRIALAAAPDTGWRDVPHWRVVATVSLGPEGPRS